MNFNKHAKDFEAIMMAYKIKRNELWYDVVFEASRIMKMSESDLAACAIALFLTHAKGNMKEEGRIELHKKIDREVFGIEAPAE